MHIALLFVSHVYAKLNFHSVHSLNSIPFIILSEQIMNRAHERTISVNEKNVDDCWHVANKVPLTEGVNKHPMTGTLHRNP